MRILFTPLGVHTHALSMVPFAWACRAAGHQVRFAAQPRAADTLVRAGLSVAVVGQSYDFQHNVLRFMRSLTGQGDQADDPAPYGPWTESAEVIAPELIRFARDWRPDLVVTDPMFYAGPLVAEVLGVPLLRLLWGPDWIMPGCGMGGFAEDGGQPAPWPDELVALYESHGARTAVDFAAATLDPFPPSLQLPGLANRVTMRSVPYNGSDVLPDWTAEPPARPRICLTWGTSTSLYLGEQHFLLPQLLSYLDGLDVEVVLAITKADRARMGDLPPHVRVAENLPLDLFLPSCAVIVNQGGSAVIASAATHAVPQVVIPLFADQPTNSRLLAATGAGIQLDVSTMDGEQVRTAVTAAIHDDEPRAAARRLQAEINSLPTPAETADSLDEIIAKGSR
ncbi:nucleotide disphospho-sugar-binding domain-containing protein [Actinosynnema sp. CS-041913]|uniref:nucleotide disphospho-sugar-binding domain-containing protein n=1 Tax=Actinosynnema sp. CS-041913 TaxID=3239917 RepID=UPI003D9328C8